MAMDPAMKKALEEATAELVAMPQAEFQARLKEASKSDLAAMLNYAHDPSYNPNCPYCNGDPYFEICGCRCHSYNGA
jgi:hypothetical protein